MASVAKSLGQLALSTSRRIPTRRTRASCLNRSAITPAPFQRLASQTARFSTSTPARASESTSAEEADELAAEARQEAEDELKEFSLGFKSRKIAVEELPVELQEEYAQLSPEEAKQLEDYVPEDHEYKEIYDDMLRQVKLEMQDEQMARDIHFQEPRQGKMGFWGEDEEDPLGQIADDDEETQNDDMTSIGHQSLEQHREFREYARIAAWDMPSLSSLAKPFEPPKATQPIRFRYTHYMGESHPAQSKVVLEVCPDDLIVPLPNNTPATLTSAQKFTLLKLAGPRYNPHTNVIKMSCEKYPNAAQNKRYLSDVLDKLIETAKTGDSFADVPLDLRHGKKLKPRDKRVFPESWLVNEQRQKQLAADRAQRYLPQVEGDLNVVDGSRIMEAAIAASPALRGDMIASVLAEKVKSGKARLRR